MGNFTNPENITSTIAFASYLNTVTSNWFWPLILATMFIIMFIGFSMWFPREDALATASFTSLLLAFMAKAMDLLDDYVLYLFVVLLMIGLAISYKSKSVA